MFNGSCGADFRPNNEHDELVESPGCSNNTFFSISACPRVWLCTIRASVYVSNAFRLKNEEKVQDCDPFKCTEQAWSRVSVLSRRAMCKHKIVENIIWTKLSSAAGSSGKSQHGFGAKNVFFFIFCYFIQQHFTSDSRSSSCSTPLPAQHRFDC